MIIEPAIISILLCLIAVGCAIWMLGAAGITAKEG
jgi:hypothetical protein